MRVLIVKTSALGDIVQTYPAVQYLRQQHPSAHIAWVVERPYAELVAAHPAVDSCLCIDSKVWRRRPFSLATWRSLVACRRALREGSYDVVIDLQGNTKSAAVVMQVRSPLKVGFAAGYVFERPNLWVMHRHFLPPPGRNVCDDYLFLVRAAIDGPEAVSVDMPPVVLRLDDVHREVNRAYIAGVRGEGDGPVVLFFAGSAWPNKQLDEEAVAAFAATAARALGFRWLFAWGSSAERAVAVRLADGIAGARVIDRLPLPQLQHLMSLTDLVVSMDSLPLHLAATAGVSTYSFFGPSSAAKYAPAGPQHGHFQGSCPYGITFGRRCPKLRTCPTGRCLHGLEASLLYDAFASWWSRRSAISLTSG